MALIALGGFATQANAQSSGLMKALNVKGQAKSITYNGSEFQFNRSGECAESAGYDHGRIELYAYETHSEFVIEINTERNRMVRMDENAQGSGWSIEFTAWDANNRPIKGDLYSAGELSKRGAKISYSGADAKGNWTKMIIDKSGARGGEPSWIPSSITRKIRYW